MNGDLGSAVEAGQQAINQLGGLQGNLNGQQQGTSDLWPKKRFPVEGLSAVQGMRREAFRSPYRQYSCHQGIELCIGQRHLELPAGHHRNIEPARYADFVNTGAVQLSAPGGDVPQWTAAERLALRSDPPQRRCGRSPAYAPVPLEDHYVRVGFGKFKGNRKPDNSCTDDSDSHCTSHDPPS